jgi:hypothetical protein
MKRLAPILFLLWLGIQAHAELLVYSNAVFNRFCSSYFTINCAGCYIDAGRYLYWPTNNIHCNSDDRSGGSIQEANENRIHAWGLAQWANGDQWFGEIWGDNNGGYTSNNVITHMTNTLIAPGRMWNGSAYVDPGGWAAEHNGEVTWILGGAIPYAGHYTGGGESEEQVNNAMTNALKIAAAGGIPAVAFDVYHLLNFTYGWSNDIQSGADLRQSSLSASLLGCNCLDGEHPGPPGALGMAVLELTTQIDTNVNTSILDFGRASISATNHAVVSSVSLTGNTLSFNWKADRHSLPWDKPNTTTGITNDASIFFTMAGAASSNAMHEDIVCTNLPNGSYSVTEDNVLLGTFATVNGVLTLNLFSITTGPLWDQRVEVLGRVRDRRYCNRISLVPGSAGDGQGEVSYQSNANANWQDGDRGDTLISHLSAKIANLNSKDALIWAAATPTNHTFAITQIIPFFERWKIR